MAQRDLLALSKIDEFAAWAKTQGFEREPIRGPYEVLRLRFEDSPPLLYFTRTATLSGGKPVHATAQHDGAQLVRRWIRSRTI